MVERWVSFINLPLLQQARARITKTLLNGIELDMSTEECKKMLRRHVNTKSNLVTMFVDINHSTEMSLSLPENKFALMLQSFAQEISIALAGYGGYVFKYEGDAVIALFPAEYDNVKACRNALGCSKAILEIINEVILSKKGYFLSYIKFSYFKSASSLNVSCISIFTNTLGWSGHLYVGFGFISVSSVSS